MSKSSEQEKLIARVADLEEDDVLALVNERIAAGDDPLRIIEDAQQGMHLVGERYEQGRYYIAGLIMAGEIFLQVMELVQPLVETQIRGSDQASGTVLLGTAQGDIHDIGKNITNMLLSCHGFTVHDLGVDVPPVQFASQVSKVQPDIVGLSGLLTIAYDSMRETVNLLRQETSQWSRPLFVIIGGGQIDEQVCHYVGADCWTNDAMEGVHLCQRFIAGR